MSEFTKYDRFLMRLNYWKKLAANRAIKVLGGYDQVQVGCLLFASKRMVDCVTKDGTKELTPKYVEKVKQTIYFLDPELARAYGFEAPEPRRLSVLGLD